MDRNHRVYTFLISYQSHALVPDPHGSGEMHHTGELITHLKTLTVIATSQAVAEAWMRENQFRYPGLVIKSCIDAKLDAIIETHTY